MKNSRGETAEEYARTMKNGEVADFIHRFSLSPSSQSVDDLITEMKQQQLKEMHEARQEMQKEFERLLQQEHQKLKKAYARSLSEERKKHSRDKTEWQEKYDRLVEENCKYKREIDQLSKQNQLAIEESKENVLLIERLMNEKETLENILAIIDPEIIQNLVSTSDASSSELMQRKNLQVKKKLQLHKWQRKVSSVELEVKQLNEQISTTKNAKERTDLVKYRDAAAEQLVKTIEESLLVLSRSLYFINIAHNSLKKQGIDSIENQLKETNLLIESYSEMHQRYKKFCEGSQVARELVSKYNSLNLDKRSIEVDASVIRTRMLQCEDEEIEDAYLQKEKLLEQEQELTTKIKGIEKSLRSLEKEMAQYFSYGEVKRLLPINSSNSLTLSDYTWIKNLGGRNSNVALYERNGEKCVLKKFFVDKDHSHLQRESNVRRLPRHPLIVPINNTFIAEDVAYVETEFVEGGTLKDWITSKQRSAKEIQNMLRLIAQAIHFIHSHDIIHCDLKPENILIKESGEISIPMLCDFELSRNVEHISTNTVIGGTHNYMPPELLNGSGRLSAARDVWSFGVIAYEMLCHPNQIQTLLYPDSTSLPIEGSKLMDAMKSDVDALDLLILMLKVDPIERMKMSDVVHHRFMVKVIDNADCHNNQVNRNSVSALKAFISQKTKETYSHDPNNIVYVDINEDILEDVLYCFSNLEERELMHKLDVRFDGEDGQDGGALTTSMYNRLLIACIGKLLTTVADNDARLYVPFEDNDQTEEEFASQYESLGKVLVKALFDQRTIPISLAPFVWRYLLAEDVSTVEVTLGDMDMVDLEFANNMRLIVSGIDVTYLYLDFSEIHAGNEEPLTNRNKHEYVKKSVNHKLIDCRRKNLDALRQGFRTIADLVPFLNQLSAIDAAVLINEQQFIDVETLISCLQFEGESDDRFKEMMISVVRGMTQREMSELLYFATGQVALYSSGIKSPLMNPNQHSPYARDKLTFKVYNCGENYEARLPVAHVCFYSVDIPLYSSEEFLREKLATAIELSRDGKFTIA